MSLYRCEYCGHEDAMPSNCCTKQIKELGEVLLVKKNKKINEKFEVVVSDPPWSFSDKLKMENVKRGAEANYKTLSIEDIKNLPVKDIVADNAILVLWVPSSLLQEGLDVMNAWGFKQKQTHVWVKTKKEPLSHLSKQLKPPTKKAYKASDNKLSLVHSAFLSCLQCIRGIKIDSILAFGMGRIFRQTHELAIIGTRGKVSHMLKNKSQRSVHFGPVTKHSAKPEDLQDMLEIMYPNTKKLEMFARRSKRGWVCLGNQSPESEGVDIRDAIDQLKG